MKPGKIPVSTGQQLQHENLLRRAYAASSQLERDSDYADMLASLEGRNEERPMNKPSNIMPPSTWYQLKQQELLRTARDANARASGATHGAWQAASQAALHGTGGGGITASRAEVARHEAFMELRQPNARLYTDCRLGVVQIPAGTQWTISMGRQDPAPTLSVGRLALGFVTEYPSQLINALLKDGNASFPGPGAAVSGTWSGGRGRQPVVLRKIACAKVNVLPLEKALRGGVQGSPGEVAGVESGGLVTTYAGMQRQQQFMQRVRAQQAGQTSGYGAVGEDAKLPDITSDVANKYYESVPFAFNDASKPWVYLQARADTQGALGTPLQLYYWTEIMTDDGNVRQFSLSPQPTESAPVMGAPIDPTDTATTWVVPSYMGAIAESLEAGGSLPPTLLTVYAVRNAPAKVQQLAGVSPLASGMPQWAVLLPRVEYADALARLQASCSGTFDAGTLTCKPKSEVKQAGMGVGGWALVVAAAAGVGYVGYRVARR